MVFLGGTTLFLGVVGPFHAVQTAIFLGLTGIALGVGA